MNDFDQAARFVAEMDPQGTLDRLLDGSGLRLRFCRWFPTNTVPRLQSPEREADNVAECDDLDVPSRRWLVVIEWQSRPDKAKLRTLLEECAAFASRARRGDEQDYSVMPALAHLTGEADPPLVDMRSPSGHGLLCRPLLWDIGKDGAAQELERIATGERSWSLLAWVPLMAGADSDIIVTRWREVLAACVPDTGLRAKVKGAALVFSELARIRPTWDRGLKEEIMGESQVLNEIRQYVAERERLATKRQVLIDLVDLRFPGQMPPEVRRLLEQQESEAVLKHWFGTAATALDYAAFDSTIRE